MQSPMMEKIQEFKLVKGGKITLSIFDGRLLFIHSEFTSSQFNLDNFGVQVNCESTSVKLALWFTVGQQNYLSLYLARSEYGRVVEYFKALGFLQKQGT